MKIVYKGKTKNNKEIIFRYPIKSDAPAILKYINAISKERTFMLSQGEQLTLKEEKSRLNYQLNVIKDKKAVLLFAFIDGEIVGVSNVKLEGKVQNHLGTLGISLSKKFRGQGIGKLLMDKTVSEAENELPGLRKIILSVFANNKVAYNLYKKCGFIEYGRLPKGIKHRGVFVDNIYMYKNTK